MQQVLIHQILVKKVDLPSLKSGIHKLGKVPSDWSGSKSKVDKSDIGKLETTPADLNKLSDVLMPLILSRLKENRLWF